MYALADPVGGCGGCNPPFNFPKKIVVTRVAVVIDLPAIKAYRGLYREGL